MVLAAAGATGADTLVGLWRKVPDAGDAPLALPSGARPVSAVPAEAALLPSADKQHDPSGE